MSLPVTEQYAFGIGTMQTPLSLHIHAPLRPARVAWPKKYLEYPQGAPLNAPDMDCTHSQH